MIFYYIFELILEPEKSVSGLIVAEMTQQAPKRDPIAFFG